MTIRPMGWCYRIGARLLDGIPVTAAGRRAFDETLADWRRESKAAVGWWAQFVVSTRGLGAVMRSLGKVAWEETALVSGSRIPQRFGLWILSLTLLGVVLSIGRLETSDGGVDAYLYSAVVAAAFYGPVLLFWSCVLGRLERPLPTLGIGLLSTFVTVVALGVVLPASNQARDAAYPPTRIPAAEWQEQQERHAARVDAVGLTKVVAAQTAIRETLPRVPSAYYYPIPSIVLGDGTVGGYGFPSTWSTLQWANRCGACLALCWFIPLLADRLRARARTQRVLIAALASWVLLYELVWAPVLSTEWLFLWLFFGFGVPWLPVIVLAGLCLVLRRSEAAPPLSDVVETLKAGLA